MNDIVIALAKAAISAALNQPQDFDLESALKTYPSLKENGAAFVTINTKSHGQLRGCIGSLHACRPLYEDIIHNAQSAALCDPRFLPLSIEELDQIDIEVSILSEPQPLSYDSIEDLKAKIVPFKDGIVLKLNGRQATYLPQVWEQLPRFEDFFSSLCLKANLGNNCLSQHPEISTYRVKKYKEGS
ncbi:AmmeMemoRadiSam system protein A [Sulfurovum sp. XGS-02]|uniref:AmmeMemoRadiSam system protein A n=1 Tax=Sulfurovum sp. XGS-02 TaxID=2925411 RepID=UPI00205F824C|nr:AmmeMemoRadiSam system protein A [Sulfurovum sp. XGS-02]UPT77001.1 AmmeMemoRadiSam system protein A [Sulfurovum sp. XGS-02]